ncbi:hypothetical protein L9G15_27090, partial [Shewanella sp. A3A]|nr:hypothetical protein [Shewanella ferrihydritica]
MVSMIMSVSDGVIFRGGCLALRRISGGIFPVRLVVQHLGGGGGDGVVDGAVRLRLRCRILRYMVVVGLLL